MTLSETRLKDRVRRARTAVGRGTRYGLGKGGMHPHLPRPAFNDRCDCSGFVAWCLGISRYQADKGKPWSTAIRWIETTAIYNDAKGKRLLFTQIPEPVPGCLVVYPDRIGQGHVAIVATCSIVGGKVKQLGIIDCSSRGKREAINERDGMFFLSMTKRGIFCVLNEDFE